MNAVDHPETDPAPHTNPDESGQRRHFNYHALSMVLRWTGAGVLVASLSSMLFRGWEGGSDLYRFYTLLGYGGVLAAIGVTLGNVVHENKGARTFLALALGAVAVNFTVLGALCLSASGYTGPVYPAAMAWADPGGGAVGLAAVLAFAVLSPITWLGMSVFARRSALRLSSLYLFGNAMLLLPVRSSLIVGLAGLFMIAVVTHQLALARARDNALSTREGHCVIALQFLPVVILLGRSFYLYAIDEILLTSTALVIYVLLRKLGAAYPQGPGRLLTLARTCSAVAVALGAAAIAVSAGAAEAYVLPVFTITAAGLIADIGLTTASGGERYTRAAGIVLASGFLLNLFVWPTLAGALLAIVIGSAVAVYGYSAEQKTVFLSGSATVAAGLVVQLHDVFRFFDFGSWSGLALVGIGAIVMASVLERHGLALRRRFMTWRGRFAEWDY